MARVETETTEKQERNYDEEFDAFMEDASKRVNELISNFNENIASQFSEEEIKRIQGVKGKIDEFNTELFESDDENYSIEESINTLHNDIKTFYKNISQYKIDLFGKDEILGKEITKQEALRLDKSQYKKDEDDNFRLIEQQRKIGIKEDIESYKDELVNIINSQKEDFSKQTDYQKQTYSEQLKKQKEEFQSLQEEVRKFLPTAMAAGLSEAYHQTTEYHKNSEVTWRWWFTISILTMVAVALIVFGINYSYGNKENYDFFVSFLKMLPIEAPLIWFAYIASQRVKQEARLHEEHLHKWSVAFSFEGLIKAAKGIDNSENKLQSDVINKFVDSYSKNPAFVIDVKSKNTPIEATIDSLSTAIEKISNSTEKILKNTQQQA